MFFQKSFPKHISQFESLTKAPKQNFGLLFHNESRYQVPFSFETAQDTQKRVDPLFKTNTNYKSDAISNKAYLNRIKLLYVDFYKLLLQGKPISSLKTNTSRLEKRLINEIDQSLKVLKENDITLEVINPEILDLKDDELLDKIDIRPQGVLHVYNVSPIREENQFIHKYQIQRKKKGLVYEEVKEEVREQKPMSQSDVRQKEFKESLDESTKKQDSSIKKFVMGTAKFLNLPEPEPIKGVSGSMFSLRNSIFKSVTNDEEYIVVEDHSLFAPFGIAIKDNKTGEVIKSDQVDSQYKQHQLRIERIHELKDAPSIWKNKPLNIVDFDFFLRGNPHAPVKVWI